MSSLLLRALVRFEREIVRHTAASKIGQTMIDGMMPADQATLVAKGRGIARALRTLADRSGRRFSIGTKRGRLEIQKMVYLLKRLDYPSARKFSYNIYLNGPYSPDLAEVYYALGDDGLQNAAPASDLSEHVARIVTDAVQRGPGFLEAVTTVLDGARTLGGLAPALGWARSIKPHLNEQTWAEVRSFLGEHPDLTRST